MTSSIDATSRLPLSGPADRERLSPLGWLSMAVVFVVAVLLRQVVPLNTDVSWLLTIGERVLNGERLYVDIVEINPPMAVLPICRASRWRELWVSIRENRHRCPDAAPDRLLAVGTWRILRLSPASGNTGWAPLAVWSAAVADDPADARLRAARAHGHADFPAGPRGLCACAAIASRFRCGRSLIAGIGAGITLAFKPFFLTPAALCIMSGGGACAFMANAVCAGEHDRRRAGERLQLLHLHRLSRIFHHHLSAGARHLSVVVDAGGGVLAQFGNADLGHRGHVRSCLRAGDQNWIPASW